MRDECFIRGEIPMTKSEIRAVSLAKLEIQKDSIVYDIGAGTGSVSVEAALAAGDGHVYAFEQKDEGCRLIRENGRRFGVENLTVVPGKAPESLKGYPMPDRVFVGGSGGNLEAILDTIRSWNPGARIVLTVIALETLARVTEYCKKQKLEPEIVCIQVSRAEVRGGYHMMQGQNPVYLVTLGQNDRSRAGGEQDDWSRADRDGGETGQADRSRLHPIPRMLIAAPASGSGKTVLTLGLLALFKRRGTRCAAFKCGPDYIDPLFHRHVLGTPGCNLDSFFLERERLLELFLHKAEEAELAVIEGVMGYYDGVGGNTCQASSYDIARITDTPVILVVDGKQSGLSLAAQVKGFLEYRKDSRIAGVILNRTSEASLNRLRPSLEALGIRCLGAVPECEEARLESRHLGLTLPEEQSRLRERLEALADRLEQWLDVEQIEHLAAGAPGLMDPNARPVTCAAKLPQSKERTAADGPAPYNRKRRMGIARDAAFCFYYQENLEFLEEAGWELVTFSPLNDRKLPEDLDGILLGGGYPELYAKALSDNGAMREAIREAASSGIRILAECGGFLYLHRTLEGTDGKAYPMAGVIPADGFRTERLSRFGYITLCAGESKIRGHEFHYWDSTAPGTAVQAIKPASDRSWTCMYRTEHMMAGFPHLYYRSNPEWMSRFLDGEGRP